MTFPSHEMRWVLTALLVLAYVAMCVLILRRQQHAKKLALQELEKMSSSASGGDAILVAFASQTGQSEDLAWHAGKLLHAAGESARVVELQHVDAELLRKTKRAIIITSTYGEGDPPDNAALFMRNVMNTSVDLKHLSFAMLAMGDSTYARYCGFGVELNDWLISHGAVPLFELVKVDRSDEAAIKNWYSELSLVAQIDEASSPESATSVYEDWLLKERVLLNEGSQGEPVFHIGIEPPAGPLLEERQWKSGDLVQVIAPADPTHPREYSIASVMSDGQVQLLVRQEVRSDGEFGIASRWLVHDADLQGAIKMRVRPHRNFRLGANADRPIIFIGNGTGLAGLRSHLKARAAVGNTYNWLIFGERNQQSDFLYRQDIEAWNREGILRRLDLVFSRDGETKEYVQHRISRKAGIVKEWVERGAAIYVCGSLEGMAGGVDSALRESVGTTTIDEMIAAGRYRRDVY